MRSIVWAVRTGAVKRGKWAIRDVNVNLARGRCVRCGDARREGVAWK
jgi:hypothetical protein